MFLVSVSYTHLDVYKRQVYAVGGNERAAHLSGIDVARVKLWGYILVGVLSGIAGFLLAGRLQAGCLLYTSSAVKRRPRKELCIWRQGDSEGGGEERASGDMACHCEGALFVWHCSFPGVFVHIFPTGKRATDISRGRSGRVVGIRQVPYKAKLPQRPFPDIG